MTPRFHTLTVAEVRLETFEKAMVKASGLSPFIKGGAGGDLGLPR